MIKVIKTSLKSIEKINGESVITIGMFDGFHIYHNIILNKVIEIGDSQNLKKIIITFDQKPNSRSNLLLSGDKKVKHLIDNFTFDYIYLIKVNNEMLETDKEEFIKILQHKLNVKKIVEGSDFTFGYKKQGNVQNLISSFGKENVCILQRDNNVSSSKIKIMLANDQHDNLKDIVDLEMLEKYNI